MPMKNIYKLRPSINAPDSFTEFKPNETTEMFKFFILNDIYAKPKKKNIILTPQKALTNKLLIKLDFIDTTIDAPVFSKRLADKLASENVEGIEFYRCLIGELHEFYIGRITRSLPIIDHENSEYMQLSDPTDAPVLCTPQFITPKTDFFIARDTIEPTQYAVSEKFISILKSDSFNIDFEKAN